MRTKVNPENYMVLEFPSKSSNEAFSRAAIACFASQMDPTLDEIGDIKTAVSEAVTNCIVHAYPDQLGMITMRAQILPEIFSISSSKTRAAASPISTRRASPCSQPAGKNAPAWGSPLWRAL